MNVQYISDSNGQTTGVFIPIREWNDLLIKYKGIVQEDFDIPDWHKEIVLKRIEDFKQNPNLMVDFDDAMNEIERKL